jgi:catechol 2,3-dioxygenase-like lactoylglutathione lyase family enzyme
MLADKPVAATLAVKDMERARKFYEDVLGLRAVQDMAGAVVYLSGGAGVLVYESEYAGTNQATAASWGVGDEFDAIVEDLRQKGVTFEHYDNLPNTVREGDVHILDGQMKGVWFKDPDGNILSVGDASME